MATTWTNESKGDTAVSEVDFLFSDGSTDFLFSDGTTDFVFREATAGGTTWSNQAQS